MLAEAFGGFWRTTLGQGDETRSPLRIPFIDFARGDGLAIGPGQAHEWTPNVIDETTPWASKYRGLWGLYAQDPISGENAPAGPDVRPRRLTPALLVRSARASPGSTRCHRHHRKSQSSKASSRASGPGRASSTG